MGFTLLGCNKNDEPKVSQNENLSLSELKEVKSELDKAYGDSDIQTHSNDSKDSALKEAMFRTNGAWTNQDQLTNSKKCVDLINQSEQVISFEKFSPNSYIIDLRVGRQNSMWTDSALQKTVNELNSTHGNIKADVSINGDKAQVDLYRTDGNILRYSYAYEKATDTLILNSLECFKCIGFNVNSILLYEILKEKGSIRNKFCRGSYE